MAETGKPNKYYYINNVYNCKFCNIYFKVKLEHYCTCLNCKLSGPTYVEHEKPVPDDKCYRGIYLVGEPIAEKVMPSSLPKIRYTLNYGYSGF